MSALSSNPLLDPGQGVTVFGKIVAKIRSILGQETEEQPLQTTFGTDAESRGFGNSPYEANLPSLSAWAFDKMRLEAGRFAAYRDYELMDGEYPEVSAALDVIAEFATQNDDPNATTFSIQCEENEEFADYLMDRAKELRMDHDVTGTAREIAKYGCAFWELVADPTGKIVKIKALQPTTMIRNEDKFGVLMQEAFTQIDPKNQQAVAHFASWQIVMGRYIRQFGRMYGSSLLEPARRVYKQLSLIEDGMVVARLYRSHMRYVFSIPVDGMSADMADNYLDKKKLDFRKKSRFNPATNKPEMFDSPIGADEDFWIGVRKEGVPAKVDTIQGEGGLNEIADIEYFQQKLFAALKVPKGLLNYEKDINARATLLVQDLNFARMLRRIQQVTAQMIKDALTRVMILDGKDPEKMPEWQIVMPEVSTKDEQLMWQVEAIKANVALIYGQKLPIVDKQYIYKQIMDLSQDEIDRLEALTPEEIGVQTMPSPPFENIDANVELGGGQAGPGGGGGGGGDQPGGGFGEQGVAFLGIPTDSDTDDIDEVLVRKIRGILGLPVDEDIQDGELKIAYMLRELREEFGDIDIDLESFAGRFRKARKETQ